MTCPRKSRIAALAAIYVAASVFAGCTLSSNGNMPGTESQFPKEYLSAAKIQEVNQRVNSLLEYGVGPQIEGRNPCEVEILSAGEGHCGMYAYLLVKELSRMQIDSIAIDVKGTFDGITPANHTIVQAETNAGDCVFDPTYGIYYTADLKTLCSSGKAEQYKMGTATEQTYFQSDRFLRKWIRSMYTMTCAIIMT